MLDPVLFLPGFMADARVFGQVLHDVSYQRAVHIHLSTKAATITEMARQALKTAPPKFIPIGHGLGALVAMEMARLAPERISAMVLINASAQSELPERAAAYEELIVKAKAGGLMAATQNALGISGNGSGEVATLAAEMAMAFDAECFARQLGAIQKRPDQQRLLTSLKMPVLVMAGSNDPLFPEQRQRFLASLLPNAKLEVFAGAGHLVTIESPALVAEKILAFLPKPFLLT